MCIRDRSLSPKQVIVLDKDDFEIITANFTEFKTDTKLDKNDFDEKSILEKSTNEYTDVASELPLYPVALMGSTDVYKRQAQEFTSAELNLYTDQYYGPNYNTEVKPISKDAILSSALVYEGTEVENVENGKKLTISYEPYEINGVTYDICLLYTSRCV